MGPTKTRPQGQTQWQKIKTHHPKTHNEKGPVRKRLNTSRSPWSPWSSGSEPKCNREHQPFSEGQAPNCPEFPRYKWVQDETGTWINPELCSSAEEEEDELGTAGSSKEDEAKEN